MGYKRVKLSWRGFKMVGEGSETEREGSGVLGGVNWGPRGREVGEKGEGSGDLVPPCPPHTTGSFISRTANLRDPVYLQMNSAKHAVKKTNRFDTFRL